MREFFYDYLLPLALQFGMSTKEFWNEEPELLWTYRKSYMDQLKMQNEINNYNAWLNGLYVFEAVSKCLYNSFGRKESQPAQNYVTEPFDFKKVKTKEKIEREKRLMVEEKIRERNRQIKAMLENKE